MKFDNQKLKNRIKEIYGNQISFAKKWDYLKEVYR